VCRNKDDKIVGQLLFFSGFFAARSILNKPLSKITLPLATKLFNVFTWSFGPLVFDKDNYEEVFTAIINYIDIMAKRKIYAIRNVTFPILDLEADDNTLNGIMVSHGFRKKLHGTFIINISKNNDELWQQLTKRAKYDVRKARNDGVEVKVASSEDEFKKYFEIVKEAKKNGGLPAPVWTRLEIILKKELNVAEQLLLAVQGDRILAGMVVRSFNKTIEQTFLANSEFAVKNKIYSPSLLTWYAIDKFAREGYTYFDLVGVNPYSDLRTKKEEGIYLFKSKWGGQLIKYNTYTKIYSRSKEIFLEQIQKLVAH